MLLKFLIWSFLFFYKFLSFKFSALLNYIISLMNSKILPLCTKFTPNLVLKNKILLLFEVLYLKSFIRDVCLTLFYSICNGWLWIRNIFLCFLWIFWWVIWNKKNINPTLKNYWCSSYCEQILLFLENIIYTFKMFLYLVFYIVLILFSNSLLYLKWSSMLYLVCNNL